ncbi:MAG: hypothetical protein AAB736_00925 [Patescibacteria group bacterium]
MGKGKTPRFTRRVHKDVLVIKAGSQKKRNPSRNKDRYNRKPDKKQGMQDFNLLKFLLALKLTHYF